MVGPNREQITGWRAETRASSLLSFHLVDTRGPSREALTVGLLLSLGWFAVAWLGLAHSGNKLLAGGVVHTATLRSEHWTLADAWPSNSTELRSKSAPRPSRPWSLFGTSHDEAPPSRVQSGSRSAAQLANSPRVGEATRRGNARPRLRNDAQPQPATGSMNRIVGSAPIATTLTPLRAEAHIDAQAYMSSSAGPPGGGATAVPELPEHVLSSYVGKYAGGPHRQFRVMMSMERGRLTASGNAVGTALLVPISARKFLVHNKTGCVIEFAEMPAVTEDGIA